MEIKRCARCGNFFSSEIEVCQNCEKKDNADVNKLKGYLMDGFENGATKADVAHCVGITMKNLNRYLNAEEFKGVNIPDIKLEESKGLNGAGVNNDVQNTKTDGIVAEV